MTDVHNLPEEEHGRWHRFIDGLNELVNEVFDGNDGLAVVVGAQWGEMGRSDHPELPTCVVTSNLPVCATASAIEDMLKYAEAAHDKHHEEVAEGVESGAMLKEEVEEDRVPDSVKKSVYDWVEKMGLKPENITFVQVADASDLNDLAMFEGEEPQYGGGQVHDLSGRVEAESDTQHQPEGTEE